MKPEARETFLKQPTVAKLATLNADGSIRMTPLWFRHDPDGSIVFGTWRNTMAARNISRDPRCSVMIDYEGGEPYYGVHMQGTAVVEGPSNDLEGIAAMYAPYKESLEQARKDVADLIEEAEMVYIRFTPEKEISWDFRE
jgi:PPOX class probable F420-dependent enzyme